MAKKLIIPGDDDPRHGSANGYGNLGCRCTPCRVAWADWYAAFRKKPRALADNDPRHGTENGYIYWHCRCTACLEASATRERERWRRKREAQ